MPGTSLLRGAIVGLGHMGAIHSRVLSTMDGVRVVAAVDSSEAALKLAQSTLPDADLYTDLDTMLNEVTPDLAIVATPTTTHVKIAEALLKAGCHCLVEKPISHNLEDAMRLVDIADTLDLCLQVGHVERFNPVILQLRERLERGEGGEILQMSARRAGPFPPRMVDVGVVWDLAIHDVDVMSMLTDSPIRRVNAAASRPAHRECEDLFVGTLEFDSGALGSLEANRLTPFKRRELTVICTAGTYVVNYLTQELTFHRNGRDASQWNLLDTFTGVSEGEVVSYEIRRAEPVRAELDSFISAVQGCASNYVSGADGVAAAHIAAALLESASTGQSVLPDVAGSLGSRPLAYGI